MSDSIFTYPRCPSPPRALQVLDLATDRIDGQVAACCLQGLINRNDDEKIYVLNTWCYDNRGGGDNQVHVSRALIDDLYPDLPSTNLPLNEDPDWPGFMALWRARGDVAAGLIVWDPALEQATIEAATTIAGQLDAVPVSPALARILTAQGARVLVDLRDHAFTDNVACLNWLLENWFDTANQAVAFTWSHMTTGPRSWGAANKDYVVALGLFTFHLDVFNEAEQRVYAHVINRYPPGTPVMGWADERVADDLFGNLGYFMVPCISVENLSVHSAVEPSDPSPRPSPAIDFKSDPAGVYVACHIADGDNLLHSMVYQVDAIRNDPAFGAVPTTWILNPGMIDLAPRLSAWYHRVLGDAHGQEFAAMMGDGHPSSERARGFKAYCRMTHAYLQRNRIQALKVMAESEAVAWNVQPTIMLGGYNGLDWRGADPLGYHYDGATFHIDAIPAHDTLDTVKQIIEASPEAQPLFLNLFCGTAKRKAICTHVQQVRDDLTVFTQRLGRRAHFVTSSQLAAIHQQIGESAEPTSHL